MPDVFIWTREKIRRCRRDCGGIKRTRPLVWSDRKILAGDDFTAVISHALESASAVIGLSFWHIRTEHVAEGGGHVRPQSSQAIDTSTAGPGRHAEFCMATSLRSLSYHR